MKDNHSENSPNYSMPSELEFAKVQSLILMLTGEKLPPQARFTLAFAKLHKTMALLEGLFRLDLGVEDIEIRKGMSEVVALGSHAIMCEMVVVIDAKQKGLDPFGGQDPFGTEDFSRN